jgi:hypothetical protein
MMTVPVLSGWAFCFYCRIRTWNFGEMIRPGAKFRNTRVGAVCAVTLSCALLAVASPQQDVAATSSGKSTTTKKTSSATTPKHHSSSSSGAVKTSSGKTTGKHSSHKKSSRVRGQQKIDSSRATAIQEALIREHYLTGEPAGTWNDTSEEAMRRYQADHGWQSKTVPDSRALISLGLGPSKDHLLNPESAMTTVPDPPKPDAATPTSHTSPATAAPVSPVSGSAPTTTSTPPAGDTSSPQ